jgi:hypothetical protein
MALGCCQLFGLITPLAFMLCTINKYSQNISYVSDNTISYKSPYDFAQDRVKNMF